MNYPNSLGYRAPIAVAIRHSLRDTFQTGLRGRAIEATLLLCLITVAGSAQTAAGTIFTTLLGASYQSYASAVASDTQGNTYVVGMTSSPDFPVTPGAFQPTYGGDYDAFVAKVGPDGKIVWATYLGGSYEDRATGVALDSAGNVWVTGATLSTDFPVVNPIQGTSAVPGQSGYDNDAFVAKFAPTGARLIYSTYLSGQATAGAAGIAVDSAGNAYVVVNVVDATGYPGTQNGSAQPGVFVTKLAEQGTLVYSYFHPNISAAAIAVDSSGAVYVAGSSLANDPTTATLIAAMPLIQQAVVFKLSPDGSTKVWETALGNSAQSAAGAIAVDGAGEVWVGGSTSSANFPLVHPLQSTLGERPIWTSVNSGANWTPIDNLPFALPQTMAVDPSNPTTLYQATADLGIFKSVDGGATWTAASRGIASPNVTALAVDPVHPQTLYAGASTAVYKSVDAANTWTAIDKPPAALIQLLVDAQNPNNLYEVLLNTQGVPGTPNFRTSTDGGATWNLLQFADPPLVTLALDPRVSGHLFAVGYENLAPPGSFGAPEVTEALLINAGPGGAWNLIEPVGYSPVGSIVVDPSTNPSTVYYGLTLKSADGGVTWSNLAPLPAATGSGASTFVVDPSGTLYALGVGGLFVSHDHAQTWAPTGSPSLPGATIVPAGSTGVLYSAVAAGNQSSVGTAGFLSKISADGSTLEYSTYLRGHQTTGPGSIAHNESPLFLTQNWISGIVLDLAGDVIVTGGTRATDFQTVTPLQTANAGLADAFAAVISADGSTLKYSTYLGGSKDDGGLAATLDPQGNLIIAGQTWSADFPVTSGKAAPPGVGAAFVAKLAVPTTPVITSVVNGASFQAGIEAGSWVSIMGSNLANTTRPWQTSDFSGVNLPTSLSGVSVKIDGVPAYLEYISSTQINVLAPSDSTTGAVIVVVDNNGAVSAPATAQLQTFAPAFFINSGTTLAVATVLPGYTPVTSSAPAHPGDLVVLWGTGFGPTNPSAPAGVVVSGAPATATVTVTVGGIYVAVVSSVLTTGDAGLYQITVQLPANVPTGAVAVQASVGGAQTQSGVTIFVGKQ